MSHQASHSAPMTFEAQPDSNNNVSSGGGGQENTQSQNAGAPSTAGPSMSVMHTIQSQQAAAGPLRSRITVVCAECKRLKLRCDRRSPCGSCLKRDTVVRCTYSAAAAEKIDVQSLHNRILLLEAQLAAVQSNPAILSLVTGGINPQYDRALLAVGQSGSSLGISLDDVAAIWLDELDLNKDGVEFRPAVPPPTSDYTQSMGALGTLDLYKNYADLFKVSSSSSTQPDTLDVGVTPQLISYLPSESYRAQLLDHLEKTLLMHPCVNFMHFKSQIMSLHQWAQAENDRANRASGSSSASAADSHTSFEITTGQRPSLSLFSVVAMGYAIGAQAWLEANGGASSSPDHPGGGSETETHSTRISDELGRGFELNNSTPHTLHRLSVLSLSLYNERYTYESYDLDHLYSLILRILYLLHASIGPQVSHELFPLIGKIVNVARMMGLGTDPEEIERASAAAGAGAQARGLEVAGVKLSIFDKELRRRLWWDVFYYDLFISDCMDRAPLIADNEHTTHLPTDVDDTTFRPDSASLPLPNDEPSSSPYWNTTYLIQKYRLARLVKSVKKRTFKDPTAPNTEPSIDQAATLESEIQQWLADLPDKLQLQVNPNWSNLAPLPSAAFSTPSAEAAVAEALSSSDSPFLIAQRCELACIANRLVLKLFVPFLRNSKTKAGVQLKTHPHAVLSTVNAAHAIIHASRVLHKVLRMAHPASYMFYSFARTLFDAAIISAHNVIHEPHSVYSRVALEDVNAALQILRDPVVSTGRGPVNGGVEGSPSEVVRIVEVMKTKAEQAMNGAGPANAGTKRKHGQVDSDSTGSYRNFHIPFIGVGVVNKGGPSYVPPTPIADDTSTMSHMIGPTIRSNAPTPVPGNYYAKARYDKDSPSDPSGSSTTAIQKERSNKPVSHYPAIGIRERGVKHESSSKSRRDSSASSKQNQLMSVPSAPVTAAIDAAADMISTFRVPPPPLPVVSHMPEVPKDSLTTDYTSSYSGEYGSTPTQPYQATFTPEHSTRAQDIYFGNGWPTNPRNDQIRNSYMPTGPTDFMTPHSAPQPTYDPSGMGMFSRNIITSMPTLEMSHNRGIGRSVPGTPHDQHYPLSVDTSYPGAHPQGASSQEIHSASSNNAHMYGPGQHQHQQQQAHHQMTTSEQNQTWPGAPGVQSWDR